MQTTQLAIGERLDVTRSHLDPRAMSVEDARETVG